MFASLYVLISFFYFSTAIYFSHYAYKHFKSISQDGLLNGMNFGGAMGPNQGFQENEGEYQRVQDNAPAPAPANNRNNNVFQGQGVRIGWVLKTDADLHNLPNS